MYRRPKFLEILLEIRREMALEADYDVDLFVEIASKGLECANEKQLIEFQDDAASTHINSYVALEKRGREIRKV